MESMCNAQCTIVNDWIENASDWNAVLGKSDRHARHCSFGNVDLEI